MEDEFANKQSLENYLSSFHLNHASPCIDRVAIRSDIMQMHSGGKTDVISIMEPSVDWGKWNSRGKVSSARHIFPEFLGSVGKKRTIRETALDSIISSFLHRLQKFGEGGYMHDTDRYVWHKSFCGNSFERVLFIILFWLCMRKADISRKLQFWIMAF